MKHLLPILLLTLLAGCDDPYKYQAVSSDPNTVTFQYRILNIEGCQYIAYHTYGYESITHKGNCTNRVHFNGVEAK